MDLEFQFGALHPRINSSDTGIVVELPNPSIGTDFKESWPLPASVHREELGFSLLTSENQIYGAINLEVRNKDLETVAYELYNRIFQITKGHSIYRVWQFIPKINALDAQGLENYQAYNKGRSTAFQEKFPHELLQTVPAASGIGTNEDSLVLVFFAGKAPAKHLENPKQMPAYAYPEKYGPRPPSFARATAVSGQDQAQLYISGTASIRGSDSVGNSLDDQLATTFENIDIMVDEFSKSAPSAAKSLQHRYRVYIRHPKDAPYIQNWIREHHLNADDTINYIIADICRAELDLEIELTLS